MAVTVEKSTSGGRISSVGNNYGSQGSGYNPQANKVVVQGSSPRLQPTYNPQVAATFSQQNMPTRISSVGTIEKLVNSSQSYLDSATKQWQDFLRSMYQTPATPKPANYDVAGARARARASAESAQNPLYSLYLNQYLDNARLQQKQQEQAADMARKGIETELSQTKEDVATGKTRATQDTATNIGQLNVAEDEFQTDTGTRAAIDRIVQSRELAKSGLTGGLGAQQVESAQTARNTDEKRQVAKFEQGRVEQNVAKARTFEDLTKTELRAGEKATTGKQKVKFDLDNYISQYGVGKDIGSSGYEVKRFAQENEAKRQAAIAIAEETYRKRDFEEFLARLSDPLQRVATRQAYAI